MIDRKPLKQYDLPRGGWGAWETTRSRRLRLANYAATTDKEHNNSEHNNSKHNNFPKEDNESQAARLGNPDGGGAVVYPDPRRREARRADLFGIDSLGRRRRIETEHLSDQGYRDLLQAYASPVRIYADQPSKLQPSRLGHPDTANQLPASADQLSLSEVLAGREGIRERIRTTLEQAQSKSRGAPSPQPRPVKRFR